MNMALPFGAARGKIKLSRKAIEATLAAHPLDKRGRYWFEDHPGLYLSISKGGCASYCLRYQKLSGQGGDFTIGRADVITPQEARDKARDSLAALTLHYRDPLDARRKARNGARTAQTRTLRALCVDYLNAAEIRALSPRTVAEAEWILEKHVFPRLGHLEATAITRRDVKECIRAVQSGARKRGTDDDDAKLGYSIANKAKAVIGRVYSWAIDEERLENNPAAFRKMFDDRAAKRVGALDENRIRAIWKGIEGEMAEGCGLASLLAIRLAFVTLQRPNEICNARLEQFDWEKRLWLIPENCTKTNTVYQVPLSEMAVDLFKRAFAESKSQWAFVAKNRTSSLLANVLSHRFEKVRHRLFKAGALPTKNIQLYDARRFGRTYIEHTLGFPDHVAEAVINHAGDQTMKRRYDVGDHSQVIRRAHEAWAVALQAIISGHETLAGNVVRFTAK